MLNVACLNRVPFQEILSGEKRNEYRIRKRPDPRLEAVQPGEPLVFLERGSNRAIRCTVVQCERSNPHDPRDKPDDFENYCYDIEISEDVELFSAPGAPHLQGWSRRASLGSRKTAPVAAPAPASKIAAAASKQATPAKKRRGVTPAFAAEESAQEIRETRKHRG